MKRLIIILSIFTGLIGVINGQVITKDLKVKIDGFELEVLNSKMTVIEKKFENDSIVKVEFEGSYIFKDNNLEFFICDKNDDNILDMIVLNSKSVKTWNNIKIGVNYVTVKEGFPNGIFGINNDFANYVAYGYQPNGENGIDMTFYFETLDNEIYSDELTQKEYEKIVLRNSRLSKIEINNPN